MAASAPAPAAPAAPEGKDDWVTAPAAAAASTTAGKDDWITAPVQHWAAPTGGEFGDLNAQAAAPPGPQSQAGADVNAVGQGLVSGVGSAIAGAGRIAQAGSGPSAQRVLAALDLVDEGKNRDAYQKLSDAERQQVGAYRGAGPNDKAAQRDALQQTIADYANPNAVTRAGMAVEGAAPQIFPVAPENEGIQTGVGRMIGGAAPALAAGAVGGPVGILASLATIGSQAYDGAYQDAVSKGASHEDADDAAGKSALAQAAVMVAPVGRLLQRVPMPMRDGLTATLVNLGQHGVEFGSANALGTFANNYVASQTYDPGRPLTQGTGHAALEGAIAGLIIPAVAGGVRGAREAPATVDDVMQAPDIDGAIAAAGKAAQAPMQVDRLNWGDIFTPKTSDSAANDVFSNPRARVQTAIDTPAFMPPRAQVPTDVIEATRPDFIPPAPPVAPEATPDAAQPTPLTQVIRQGTTAPGTSILNSNSVKSPTRAANDVNPLLPPPANDAEAYPAWNASRTQQSAQEPAPGAAQVTPPPTPTPAAAQNNSIVTPSQTVPGGVRQTTPVPQSAGSAASRDMTSPDQIAPPADEFAANRYQGEVERLAAPPATNDSTIYIPGTKPTLAETTGDPVAAMDQAYNRQQPEALTQHLDRENKTADAVADYYADTAGSAPTLLRLERARDATAQQNIRDVFGDPQSARAPADPSPTINLMDGMLNDPRQAERNSVVKILSSLSEKFYDDDGQLKTDPYALYGIGEHINDLLRGTGDTETNSAARVLKRELMQIKGSLYDDIEAAAPGFAKYRADYQRDSQTIDAMQLLQDSRLSLLSGTHQHITPAKWFSFMRGIVEGRADPMDPASSLSEDQMDRLWNITDQLKRQTFIDAGKPRGSWTSMMQEWGGRFGRLAAHGVAAHSMPFIGNIGVEMGVAGLRKRSVSKEMNRVLNPDLGQQPSP